MTKHPGEQAVEESEFVQELRKRLLAMGKARVAGAKLASIVGEVLPAGQTFRDLLPDGFDPQTSTFRVFVEQVLKDVVTITAERRGTDLLYNIIGSHQEFEPEPGELWRAFVSIKQKQQLVLDVGTFALRTLALSVQVVLPCRPILPVTLQEHKGAIESYRDHLRQQDVVIQQLDELVQNYDANSYTKLLRALRSHTPPLEQAWGEFRKAVMLQVFESRLRSLSIDEEHVIVLLRQFTEDAPRSMPSAVAEVKQVPVPITETEEERVRRHLHAVVDRMTLEQMNELLIPFSLFHAGKQ